MIPSLVGRPLARFRVGSSTLPHRNDFRPGSWQHLLFRHRALTPNVSEDVALGELLDLLSDDYARAILAATSVRPMSAEQLAEECDMSQPTVYRRAERLQAFDLLEEQTRVRPGGNDYNVYGATLSEFSMQLVEGSYEASVESSPPPAYPGDGEDDAADRFTKMWEHL